MAAQQQQQHFLIVVVGVQGQINPARDLACRITHHTAARVTIATPISSHRRMFPDTPSSLVDRDRISFAAYSDGFDAGFQLDTDDPALFASRLKTVGTETLASLASDLFALSRPVTCIVYSIMNEWAADVAADLGIPSVLYRVQPASLFAIYRHYFSNRPDLSDIDELVLPGLPPLRKRDLPSILLTPNPWSASHEELFRVVSTKKQRVLVNTFHALERDVIASMKQEHDLDLIPIGPMINKGNENKVSLFEEDKSEYLKWLDSKEDRSVVYVSFGSVSTLTKGQMEEIMVGLEKSAREYLWVVRKDNGKLTVPIGVKGMIVEWCDQLKVLSHRAVGCFVTHGGWNSTLESVASGVPMVVMPQWLDQTTNARLVEGWGVGVRADRNEEGVVKGEEVERCIGYVLGDQKGEDIRRKALIWREKAQEAAMEDGDSVRSLVDFVNLI